MRPQCVHMYTLVCLCCTSRSQSHKHPKVYKCTHCGRKGHLAKFCYDRIHHVNFAKKNCWVPLNASPRGPKKKWVPKPPPFAFNVGEGPHKTWEDWCLGSGCSWTWWTYFWDASLSRSFGGKDHQAWSFGVGNNL